MHQEIDNQYTIDWEYPGLVETLEVLTRATIKIGRGRPAVLPAAGKGRVLAFSCGVHTGGIPPEWAAGEDNAGVNRLPELWGHAVRVTRCGGREITQL